MVHPTNKIGHRTTGTFGIPSVSDCSGSISRAEWDSLVIQEATEAKIAQQKRLEEKRKLQQEHAAVLLRQMNDKKQREEDQKSHAWVEETRRLKEDVDAAASMNSTERRMKDMYREYLHHCHEFSVASQGLLTNGIPVHAGGTLSSSSAAAESTYNTPQRKLVLQQGSNMMPFVGPSALTRERIDAQAKEEQRSALQYHNERSPSPRDVVTDKWRTQKEAYDRECHALEAQEQRRQNERDARMHRIDKRAERAVKVAPSPPRVLTPRGSVNSIAPVVSPRQPTAPSSLTRRQVQDVLKASIEEQIAERQRATEEETSRRRDDETKRVKRLEDMITSQKVMEQRVRDTKQRSYRAALEDQFRDHTQPRAAGFLPDVAVNPYRSAKARV